MRPGKIKGADLVYLLAALVVIAALIWWAVS